MKKHEIKTERTINASMTEVMKVLLDSGTYQEWNPFVSKVEGSFDEDQFIKITVSPPNSSKMIFKPKVLKVSENEIRWKGKLFIEGMFDGEHYFKLIPISENRTRIIHGEVFSGFLVPLFSGTLKNTEKGFELMNEALEKRVLSMLKL